MITIPEYYKRFIDPATDLAETPKVCCPFHQEDTPSFSYSIEKNTWRCFGACKRGGDVIELHRANYRLHSRAEAKDSLCQLLGIKNEPDYIKENDTLSINASDVRLKVAYAKALQVAKTIEDYLELDYLMSQTPIDVVKLEMYYNAHSN